MKLNIFPIKNTEYPLLEEFSYHAIYQPPDTEPLPREVIFEPALSIYFENFGSQKGDVGVIAEWNGLSVGVAWTRIIPGYGHVDMDTPELAISVLPMARGQGVGSALLSHLFDLLREQGFHQTSLSVQKANPAFRLYQRMGYQITLENEEDYIMVKDLHF
jgi:ribosomal protein S18 acetylase RimI-like enzyme